MKQIDEIIEAYTPLNSPSKLYKNWQLISNSLAALIDHVRKTNVLTEGTELSNEYEIEYRIKANCLTEFLVCVSH